VHADDAFAVAVASLPGMGPSRLRALLDRHPPAEAWARVRAGAAGDPWRRAAVAFDVEAAAAAHVAAGVQVCRLGAAGYPPRLAEDPEAPAVLFAQGDPSVVASPAVAVVGTRRCTHAGRGVAREMGEALAAAGAHVVSGLALGIDGAAHEGALAAAAGAPVGVVGSGLDVVYPRRHASLWERVAAAGVLLAEWPLGTRPDAWRFPARNRLIAVLCDVLVVVESHAAGGAMHTVEAADRRGRTVLAVPGSVRNPAAAGTNRLLFDGHGPARDPADVLCALGLATAGLVRGPAETREAPAGTAATVLEAVDWEPTSTEAVLARTGLSPVAVATALDRLERAEWVRGDGGWWERVGRSS
jgi:DNA processing protein